MNIIDSFLNNQLVLSILILFIINTLAFLVFLLVRQRNKIQQDLSRIEHQIAALAELSFDARKHIVEAEKRMFVRIAQLKQEGATQHKREKPQVEANKVHVNNMDVPILEPETKPKRSAERFSSQAEEDILAAIAAA
jgi:hypothetical protein